MSKKMVKYTLFYIHCADYQILTQMWHVGDYHLFNHRQAVEFVSICVRISKYIQRYQMILFDALLNVEVPAAIHVKRDRPATSESDQGPPSKRIIQMSKRDVTATYTVAAKDDSTVGPTTVGTTQHSNDIKENFEDITQEGTYGDELEVLNLLCIGPSLPFQIETHYVNEYDFVGGRGITTADVLHYLNVLS